MNNTYVNKPEEEIICFCTGTTKEKIKHLINHGIDSVDKIAYETGAGTGCGGCDYLITELLSENEPEQPPKTL